MKTITKLWLGLLSLIVLSPLGLILPARFGAGSAWGEWNSEEITKLVGYMPSGMSRLGDIWKAPVPDYRFRGQENASIHTLSIAYVCAGLVGLAVVSALSILVGKALTSRGRQ
jgi:cobalt/nickel transport protein